MCSSFINTMAKSARLVDGWFRISGVILSVELMRRCLPNSFVFSPFGFVQNLADECHFCYHCLILSLLRNVFSIASRVKVFKGPKIEDIRCRTNGCGRGRLFSVKRHFSSHSLKNKKPGWTNQYRSYFSRFSNKVSKWSGFNVHGFWKTITNI